MTYSGHMISDIEATVENHLVDERYSLIEETLEKWYLDAYLYASYRAQRRAWPNRDYREWQYAFEGCDIEELEARYQKERP